ncbi:SDR family oxidoreductase [Ascidiimonas aurantiaca]|uniref:SDR family oxidoreductase n=1 Tax=Ascidiimonas aurantiaca TaxID=1685432 RepID=UPI0030EC9A07
MHKVVVITGGSSGLGKAMGCFLHEKGYRVYGTSRDPEKYNEKLPFSLISMDVRDKESVEKAIQSVLHKEKRIDILINNAGIGITGPVEEIPYEEMEAVFKTNLYGPVTVMKAVLPAMRMQKQGHIINITSIAGYMGLPYRGLYSATKGALELVTEALRMEVKSFGIHVSNLAPGDFATNIAAGRYHAPAIENSPYYTSYSHSLKLMDEHVDEGGDPIKVARKVYRIINTKKPGIHYRSGAFMQKLSVVLKRVLPPKFFEKLLCNHYKL